MTRLYNMQEKKLDDVSIKSTKLSKLGMQNYREWLKSVGVYKHVPLCKGIKYTTTSSNLSRAGTAAELSL